MTRDEAKNRIELLKRRITVEEHFANGGLIESRDSNSKWAVDNNPKFNWCEHDYRIKPEPKYRRFKKGDIVLGAIVREKGDRNHIRLVTSQAIVDGLLSVAFGFGFIKAEKLFNEYEVSVDGGLTWGPAGVPLPYEQQVEPEKKEDPKAETTSEQAPQSGDWKTGNHPE